MGQYYRTVISQETDDGEIVVKTIDNDCKFPHWVGLKLMEHSYLNNDWTDALAREIYHKKARIAHVGDYANEYPQYVLAYSKSIRENPVDVRGQYDEHDNLIEFDYSGKYFVNWDKRAYISFDDYKKKGIGFMEGVYTCPMTLLTALGNDRGGGDYHEGHAHYDDVGEWAWDMVSIEDEAPKGFLEEDIYFTEGALVK